MERQVFEFILLAFTFGISTICALVILYLGLGFMFPGLNLRIEHKIRKNLMRKPSPIIVGDSDWYIRKRNRKLIIWFGLIFIISKLISYFIVFSW